ncbi:MAG TPA: hypothetical protein VGW79_08510, partial [Actinomycetota bacterium]|nr:hypothetical protein [Actinomycetota bacterium]
MTAISDVAVKELASGFSGELVRPGDPKAQTITPGPGCRWRDVDGTAGAHGLATTGGTISSTGIAGFTLGGG